VLHFVAMFRISLGRAMVGCAALNLAAVAVLGGYDHRFWFVHLVAHDAFKPEQLLVAALVIALVLRPPLASGPVGSAAAACSLGGAYSARGLAFLLAVPAILYLPSVGIHFEHHDWNYVHVSSAIRSVRPLLALFTHPQPDGFYRPYRVRFALDRQCDLRDSILGVPPAEHRTALT